MIIKETLQEKMKRIEAQESQTTEKKQVNQMLTISIEWIYTMASYLYRKKYYQWKFENGMDSEKVECKCLFDVFLRENLESEMFEDRFPGEEYSCDELIYNLLIEPFAEMEDVLYS